MRINGQTVSGPNTDVLVFPRPPVDGENMDIVLKFQAVEDLNDMEEVLQIPQPPTKLVRNEQIKNYGDEAYIAQMHTYSMRRLAYIVLATLKPSNIEWDSVDMKDPTTWMNYVNDFKKAGFSQVEINKVGAKSMEVNALDDNKLEAARQLFLRGRHPQNQSSGQNTPPANS